MEKPINNRNIAVWVVIACIFTAMLVFNTLTPLTEDDFFFCFGVDDREPLTGFGDIIKSLSYLRENVNGRVFPHFMAHVFLAMPKIVFNILNAANAALLAYMLYRFIKTGDKKKDTMLLVSLLAMIWVLLPAFGQVFLWLTGSFNYSWTITFSLIFLYPFFAEYMEFPDREHFKLRKNASGISLFILLQAEAFIAGAYSENGAFSMLGAATCLLLLIIIRDKKFPKHLAGNYILACIGFVFLMFSPSELNGRRGSASESSFADNLSMLGGKLSGVFSSVPDWLIYAAIIGAVLVLALFVWLFMRKRKLFYAGCIAAAVLGAAVMGVLLLPQELNSDAGTVQNIKTMLSDTKESLLVMFGLSFVLLMLGLMYKIDTKKILVSLVFLVAAVASLIVFIFAAYFPARSACPATFYTGLACVTLVSGICDKKERILPAYTGIFAVIFAFCFVLGTGDIVSTYQQELQRQAIFEEARESGDTKLLIETITAPSKYSSVWPREYANFNMDMARLYGLDEIWILDIDYA